MTAPARILFTIPNFVTAGSGRAMLNVVERLDPSRFAPSICSLKAGGPLEEEIARLHIPYFQAPFMVPATPRATLMQRAWAASRHFRTHRFVLWHSFHYLDDYTEPIVARLSGARAWVYTKKNMSWNRRSWYLRSLLASELAAQNSDMMRDFFSGPTLRRHSRLLPPGVDASIYRPDAAPRLNLRSRFPGRRDSVVVGCVAHMTPVKGHPTLIEAAALVPEVTIWLAGREQDAVYVAALRRQVAELGLEDRVLFLGAVDDVPALLAELDVFVLPTQKEGCPVALLEAMAAGRACVASDAPGPRDVIDSGKNGVLVRSGDPGDLAEALRSLALDAGRRRDMGVAARQRALGAYSLDREVHAYEAMYSRALPSGLLPGGNGLSPAAS